jgi:hypothetical protein
VADGKPLTSLLIPLERDHDVAEKAYIRLLLNVRSCIVADGACAILTGSVKLLRQN